MGLVNIFLILIIIMDKTLLKPCFNATGNIAHLYKDDGEDCLAFGFPDAA